ncbi:class I SAM-dependent methyltransferase [Roseovarius atlanticus]|uniref:class I SAM-dependent methyltransferase n=1 Tax=Roseovarius atlanticus TaxID=1641875 RepID=UPI001C960CF8|nr:methyltransferase domain-containing protein [Roseovarius atlanticus]MBY5986685.1 methyltransferase domain-containing protein [Roseovarius atlanticus]MBY6125325.1 methyltransferase domain-containing protein [Roseovarius atlanticus]MBY6150214.1 methyltransferase domain-containing protein [Roseovarius atlanticus]
MSGIVNTEQADHWSGKAGEVWVREQAMFDGLMAPVLDLLLDRAGLQAGDKVVDIGCGTGAGLIAEAKIVGEAGHVTGLDVSGPMLDLARQRLDAEGVANATCVLADAQVHPFGDMAADHLVSRFGVMFFDDPMAAFANMRGALKPGGRMTFVCWAGMAGNPWFRVPAEAAKSVVGAPPPQDPRAPGPMAFSEADYVRDILGQAGFDGIGLTTEEITLTPIGDLEQNATFAAREGPAGRIVKDMGGGREEYAAVAEKLRDALKEFEAPDGALRVPGRVHVVSASAGV